MKIFCLRLGSGIALALIALGALLTQLAAAAPAAPLATFTVTKTADTNDGTCNADCSLREAIGAANAAPGSSVIVPAGTYILTLFGYLDDNNTSGDLDIKANMTISSATGTKPIIQEMPGSYDRVMHTLTDTNVILNNVVISNGTGNIGGGIYALGNLSLNNVDVISNSASWGGGLYMDGHVLTINGGTWQKNSAGSIGGGLVNVAGNAAMSGTTFISNTAARGGAVASSSNFSGTLFGGLTLTNVQILSNTAPLTDSLGGGIYNNSPLTLTAVNVRYNQSGGTGGGLYNTGLTTTISISGSQFVSNTAILGGGGGIFNYAPMNITNTLVQSNTATGGGGINNNGGTVTVSGGLIANNKATDSGGSGGGIRTANYMKLSGVTIRNNVSVGSGGGILSAGQLLLFDSAVISNTAFQGGGLQLENSVLINHTFIATNTATYGGGLFNYGTISLTNGSALNNNSASTGGGAYNYGTLQINGSTVISNSTEPSCLGCSNGGGILNLSNLQLSGAIIASNRADNGSGAGVSNAAGSRFTATNSAIISNTSGLGNGGGISNTGTMSLTNVTLSANTTNGHGGGLANLGSAYLSYVTIANNTADNDSDGSGTGGGVANSGAFTLTGTIIGNNQVKTGLSADCAGTLYSGDYNVLETMANCTVTGVTTHNHPSADPALNLLTYSGGTWVHPLLNNSLAVNDGNPADCPPTDQRGVNRPIGATCDIGAYESAVLSAQTISFDPLPDRIVTNPPFIITATASSGLGVSLNSTGVCNVAGNLVTLSGIVGSCTITATQSGNSVYAPAPEVARTFSIKPLYKVYLPLALR